MIEDAQYSSLKNERRCFFALSEYVLGKVYLQIAEGAKPISIATMAKNIGFLVRNLPFASRKAEDHLNKAIKLAREIGAKGVLGRGYLDLGLLYKVTGRIDQARKSILKAVQVFEQCEAVTYLKQAKEALENLE